MDYVKNKAHSIYRNPLIAEILYKSQYIDSYASGIKRMYDECNSNGVKLDFREEKIGFTIIFYRKNFENNNIKTTQTTQTTQITSTRLNDTQIKMLEIIMKDNKITREKLAKAIGITSDGIKYNISVLKKKGFLRRIGNKNSGHWEIVKRM